MTSSNGSAALSLPAEGRAVDASIIERVIAAGDLAKLQAADRVSYYVSVCRSVGLNPLTRPFEYLSLNGKLTLYSTKNCTDQLRQIHGVSVERMARETIEGVHVVTAHVLAKDGRRDEDIGAVSVAGLRGEALANALMKATTKAKRRATLSICGLSFPDESELDTIPEARRVMVTEDGEIIDPPKRLGPIPVQPSKIDAALFDSLCQQIDAAESKGVLNKVAAAAKRGRDSGALSPEHYAQLARASNTKAKVLADKPSGPRVEYDEAARRGIEEMERAEAEADAMAGRVDE